MLEVHILLQRGYHDQRIHFHGRPNMIHCTTHPSSKVRVGTWLDRSYHGHTQCTGGCQDFGCYLYMFENSNIISRITPITVSTSWSNVSMWGDLFLTSFCLDATNIESCMTRISDYSNSSFFSLSCIPYNMISVSSQRVLSLGRVLPLDLAVEFFTVFRLVVLPSFLFLLNKSRFSIRRVAVTLL